MFRSIGHFYYVRAIKIGKIITTGKMAEIWFMYGVFTRYMDRKFLATGISFIASLPFRLIMNFSLWLMIGVQAIDIWDLLSAFVVAVIGVACIIYDRKKFTSA